MGAFNAPFIYVEVIIIFKKYIIFILMFMCISLTCITSVNAKENGVDIYVDSLREAEELFSYTQNKLPRNYTNYCGAYTHDIATTLGIIKPDSASYNGKDWFSGFNNKNNRNKLCKGWKYECFPGVNCLNDVLEKYDGEVYNLIFSMKSNSPYGHVLFVNAIINGKVYFSESYNTYFAPSKQMAVLPIDEFKDYYFGNNSFENGGIIHFYEKDFYVPIISINAETGKQSKTYIKTDIIEEKLQKEKEQSNLFTLDEFLFRNFKIKTAVD